METQIPNRLATLGHPQRLALFRLLMRRYPDRVPASELARALELKPNTLSTYVSALMQAGLVTQERSGTSLRYAIHMEAARETIDYLLIDCCRGRPEICAPRFDPVPFVDGALSDRKFKVLFVCTGNSARSIFAEALLRDMAGDRFIAYSAGTQPRSELNPFALDALAQQGHDIAHLRPKTLSEFQSAAAPTFDFLFTVCNQAANEDGPPWQGQPVTAHWGLPDPAKSQAPDAQKRLAFQQTYAALRHRMTGFTNLPIASLDRLSLQKAVDDLGQSIAEGYAK
jgi:protein-tyrosine-phosphatase/DNA-binding transcriptional ArsR family regulator